MRGSVHFAEGEADERVKILALQRGRGGSELGEVRRLVKDRF